MRNFNWTELSHDIVDQILEKFTLVNDQVRFGAVCTSWQYVFRMNRSNKLGPHQLASFVLDIQQYTKRKTLIRFYSIMGRRFYEFQPPVPLNNCFPSSGGWVLIAGNDRKQRRPTYLLNPFLSANNKIGLPWLSKKRLNKLIWFQDRTFIANDVAVVVVYDKCLSLLKSGYKPRVLAQDSLPGFHDVIYYKDRLFAVENGGVSAYQIRRNDNLVYKLKHDFYEWFEIETEELPKRKSYLVESSGKLLMVHRICSTPARFQVLELDSVNKPCVALNNLGSRSLIISDNFSMSISASDFPGCKPSCIYFSYDGSDNITQKMIYFSVRYETGVYDLETNKLCDYKCDSSSLKIGPSYLIPVLFIVFVLFIAWLR